MQSSKYNTHFKVKIVSNTRQILGLFGKAFDKFVQVQRMKKVFKKIIIPYNVQVENVIMVFCVSLLYGVEEDLLYKGLAFSRKQEWFLDWVIKSIKV